MKTAAAWEAASEGEREAFRVALGWFFWGLDGSEAERGFAVLLTPPGLRPLLPAVTLVHTSEEALVRPLLLSLPRPLRRREAR